MGSMSWWHWLIIAAAFILLFGAKKLPDAARGVGRSLRILKSEVAAMIEDDNKPTDPLDTTDQPAINPTTRSKTNLELNPRTWRVGDPEALNSSAASTAGRRYRGGAYSELCGRGGRSQTTPPPVIPTRPAGISPDDQHPSARLGGPAPPTGATARSRCALCAVPPNRNAAMSVHTLGFQFHGAQICASVHELFPCDSAFTT